MTIKAWVGSLALIASVIGTGTGVAAWKQSAADDSASASSYEPTEAISVAAAKRREHRRLTTSIGTVLALRSITLRNELPGTVRRVALQPGRIVEAGEILVALDVSVEDAELKAQQAQAALAQSTLDRLQRAVQKHAASEMELDRARAERDVALAQIARTQAIIARKTIRAPFRARVGMADVHPGQYLSEGTHLTTLQGIDDAAHVDFAVPQPVASGLRVGESVQIFPAITARIVALDARVDRATRNATVRARIEGASTTLAPGASVRVQVPVGEPIKAVSIPAGALRRGPEGDHVFVLTPDESGKLRARVRRVRSGTLIGDEILILEGLEPEERVADSGSFKLRDGLLVAIAN